MVVEFENFYSVKPMFIFSWFLWLSFKYLKLSFHSTLWIGTCLLTFTNHFCLVNFTFMYRLFHKSHPIGFSSCFEYGTACTVAYNFVWIALHVFCKTCSTFFLVAKFCFFIALVKTYFSWMILHFNLKHFTSI